MLGVDLVSRSCRAAARARGSLVARTVWESELGHSWRFGWNMSASKAAFPEILPRAGKENFDRHTTGQGRHEVTDEPPCPSEAEAGDRNVDRRQTELLLARCLHATELAPINRLAFTTPCAVLFSSAIGLQWYSKKGPCSCTAIHVAARSGLVWIADSKLAFARCLRSGSVRNTKTLNKSDLQWTRTPIFSIVIAAGVTLAYVHSFAPLSSVSSYNVATSAKSP